MSTKIVTTSYGTLNGVEKTSRYDGTNYLSFQGVPYAKPPVGNLRFKEPQALESWEGVRNALKEGNRPPHYDMVTKSYTGDEDCLYLNIYVPKTNSSSLLPVMTWIYGGGFAYGHGDSDVYGPEYLMAKNVILITINYRLGVLGFLNLETSDAPGNMGLKDQVAAFKWIKKEIKNFGGDPNNITIFGESAGGSSVHCHMLSPLSKGLFNKAIIQSGSAVCNWAFTKYHLQRAFDLGKLLGCETTDKSELLNVLLTVPPKTFAGIQDKIINEDGHIEGTDQAFVVTVDGQFFPEEPLELLKKGLINDIPTIIGIVSHEGFLMYNSIAKWPDFIDKLDKKLEVVSPYPIEKSKNVSEGIRKFYFKNEDKIDFDKHSDGVVQLFSHTLFLFPIILSLKHELSHSSRSSPIYFYRFSFDGNLGWFKKLLVSQKKISIPEGVSHVDEIGYLLSNDLAKVVPCNPTNADKEMLDKMTTMWTNFAKNGNPNISIENQIWLPIKNTEDIQFLEISSPTEIKMKSNLDKEQIDFWFSKI